MWFQNTGLHVCWHTRSSSFKTQLFIMQTVIPRSISGIIRDSGMHGNTSYNIRNRFLAGLSSGEQRLLKPIEEDPYGGLVSCFSLALTYTASMEPPGLSTVPQGNSKGLWLLPIISARTQQLSSTHVLQPKQRHSEGTRNRHTPGTIAKMKKFHLSLWGKAKAI